MNIKTESLVHISKGRERGTNNVGIVETEGLITVPVTVIAVNKHSLRSDLPRLRQRATGRHKNVPQPLTEHTCLETVFQASYLMKCRRERASLCPGESMVGARAASLPLKGLQSAKFIRDLLS